MINTIYASDVTEYESGYGQRPDGYLLAIDNAKYEEGLKTVNDGPFECYSRAGSKKLVRIKDEMYEKVKINGYLWTNEPKVNWYIEG
jgi:hypothetical protein